MIAHPEKRFYLQNTESVQFFIIMSDKKGFMGLAALAAAGAGAAMLMKKTREINEEENLHERNYCKLPQHRAWKA